MKFIELLEAIQRPESVGNTINRISMHASQRFFDEGNIKNYDPNRDISSLARIIKREIGAGVYDSKEIKDVSMKASKKFWRDYPDYDPDKDVKFLAKIIEQEIKANPL